MKKSQVKSLVLSAAVTGLLTAAAPAFATSTSSTSNTTVSNSSVRMMANAFQSDKHSCKGQNSCKGQGGCKAGDNG